MKSENQIIVYDVNQESHYSERTILQNVLLSFCFSVFVFSMPFKMIIIATEFIFLGINIFWTLLRAHINPHLTAQAKTSLSRAQNIFMPANITLLF